MLTFSFQVFKLIFVLDSFFKTNFRFFRYFFKANLRFVLDSFFKFVIQIIITENDLIKLQNKKRLINKTKTFTLMFSFLIIKVNQSVYIATVHTNFADSKQ